MPAGLLVALWLAQAEPAPPAAAPPAAEPGPAEAAPAPPAPAPEPAAEATPVEPAYFLAVGFGGGRRLAPAAADVPPAYGLAVSTVIGRRYALVYDRVELGAAFHFAYGRFSKGVTATTVQNGMEVSFDDIRSVAHYDFALVQTIAVVLGPVRPFAGVGLGLGLGHFLTQEKDYRPGTARVTRPLARANLGFDVALPASDLRIGADLDYARLFNVPTFTTEAGRPLQVFGERLTASLWLRYDF